MNTKHGVIFDMDGVIFNTERLWKKAFESANEEYGLNLSEEYRQRLIIKEFDFSAHLEVWKDIFDKLGADDYEPVIIEEMLPNLRAIASGYYVVCYDMDKVPVNTVNYLEYIKQGLYCCEVALFMYSSRLIANKKEALSCYIRRLRLFRKMHQTLSHDEMVMVSSWFQLAVNEYMEQYKSIGFFTGKLLLDSIALYHEDALDLLSEIEYNGLIEAEDSLQRVLYNILV